MKLNKICPEPDISPGPITLLGLATVNLCGKICKIKFSQTFSSLFLFSCVNLICKKNVEKKEDWILNVQ